MIEKKAVLFDCWNTLFRTEKGGICSYLTKYIDSEVKKEKIYEEIEKSFMRGGYSDLGQQLSEFLESKGKKPSERELQKIIGDLERIYRTVSPFPDTFETLEYLKKNNYALVMVTNTFSIAHNIMKNKFEVSKIFDSIIASHKEGLLKPDPEIFVRALESIDLKKKEVVMVGDSLEADFNASRDFGIEAVLVDTKENHSDREPRIKSLRELRNFL